MGLFFLPTSHIYSQLYSSNCIRCAARGAEPLQLNLLFFLFAHFHIPASGQAVVTGVVPSPPPFLPSIFIAHRVQQSHCSSIFHRVLLTHVPALSASQSVHKKKSRRTYTSMHSAGLELTKLSYTRLEDNLIRHRGDRHFTYQVPGTMVLYSCLFIFSSHLYFPASGQSVVTGVVPSPPRFLPSTFIAHRVQQSHCSSIFHRVLLTHAFAFRKSICAQEKVPTNIYL